MFCVSDHFLSHSFYFISYDNFYFIFIFYKYILFYIYDSSKECDDRDISLRIVILKQS